MFYGVPTNPVIPNRPSKMADSETRLFFDRPNGPVGHRAMVILDRGFGNFNVCRKLGNLKRDFCTRITSGNSLFPKQALENPENGFIAQWDPGPGERETRVRYHHDKIGIRVGATEIKPRSGETGILVSPPCNMRDICTVDMDEPYFLRWGIEEGFKKLEPKMKPEQFGSRKPGGISRESRAHMFMIDIIAVLGIGAQGEAVEGTRGRKPEYGYNWQNASRYTRREMVGPINERDPPKAINLPIALIPGPEISIGPGREFPGIIFKKRKNRLHQTYR